MADSQDDMISLEDLVGDLAAPPAPPPPAEAEAPPPAASAGPADKELDVDGLLAAEDPTFASSMAELKKQGGEAQSEAEIDSLDLDALSREKPPGRVRLFFEWILRPINARMGEGHTIGTRLASLPKLAFESVRRLAASLKSGVLAFVQWFRAQISRFIALPVKAKLTFLAALFMGVLSAAILKMTLAPKFSLNVGGGIFFRSFAEVADARFDYDEDEPMEDFTDPLSHPEHVMLLDKFVVNLRHPRDGSANPMGLFEFYLEASNQDTAVEIKDRQGEIRDVIGRNLEQMGYNELVAVEGKEKLKVILRKSVNAVLTKGQVRHIYIKTIVLKP